MRAQVRTDRAMYLYIAFSLVYWVCYLAVKQIESNELKNELTICDILSMPSLLHNMSSGGCAILTCAL